MNQKELKELIEFLIEKDIAEFELERGDVKVKIRRAGEHSAPHIVTDQRYFAVHAAPPAHPEVASAAVPPTAPPAQPPSAAKEDTPDEGLHMVKSPIVGTFYESPSPGAPPF